MFTEYTSLYLVQGNNERLVGKQRFDALKELQLLLDGVSALLRDVHHVENGSSEVSQRRDGLHLDGVPVLQGVVQNARGVHHLPAEVAVVHVADEERLGGEGVGLDLHVRPGDLVHEAGFPHVGEAADQEGARVGVNGGQAGEMLSHLWGRIYTYGWFVHEGQQRWKPTSVNSCSQPWEY